MMEEARRHLPMMEEARVCPPSSIAQGLPPMVECAMAALPASRTDRLPAGEGLGKVARLQCIARLRGAARLTQFETGEQRAHELHEVQVVSTPLEYEPETS